MPVAAPKLPALLAAAKRGGWAKYVRTEADERAVRNGCRFDLSAAQHVENFFRRFLRHSKGQWAGKPFELLDWQRGGIIEPIFGWKRADGTRRYRQVYIECSKKNGKSTICSGIALYLLIGDGEAGAEVYSAAADRAQAGIVFNEAANMVKASPALTGRITLRESVKAMGYEKTRSTYQALSAEVATKEGLNIHGLIFDELHAQPSRAMFDTLRYGGAARRQPLLVSITTAGWDRHSICWEQHQYAAAVIANDIEDEQFFGYIAAAAPEDDWTKEETWRKANPSYGVTIGSHDFESACKEAQESPAKENSFRRYRLSQWTEQAERWLPMDKWNACAAVPDLAALKGRTCHAGVDLAKTGDIAAAVLVFPDDAGRTFDVLPFFWIPAERARHRQARDKVPYDQWIQAGHVTATEGNSIDYAFIRARLVDLWGEYPVESMAFDPYNATHLMTELVNEDGLPADRVVTFPQNIRNLNEPTQFVETLVRDCRLRHGGHPVLKWMAGNVMVKTDASGNIRPVKPEHKDAKKIDGIVALIMAVGRAMTTPEKPKSVYETRGILTI